MPFGAYKRLAVEVKLVYSQPYMCDENIDFSFAHPYPDVQLITCTVAFVLTHLSVRVCNYVNQDDLDLILVL